MSLNNIGKNVKVRLEFELINVAEEDILCKYKICINIITKISKPKIKCTKIIKLTTTELEHQI
jgi:hypothetical protein